MISSKLIGNFSAVSNFDQLCLKLNRFTVTNCRFYPIIGVKRPLTLKSSWMRILSCLILESWGMSFIVE